MVKLCRLKEVLNKYKNIFLYKIDEEQFDNFQNKVIEQYVKLHELKSKYVINKYYMHLAVPVVAIYKVMHNEYNISTQDAVNIIYLVTYYSTENIFIDLSFVQMAYYLIYNKPYLKQLMLNSLSEFDVTDMKDDLQEHEIDEELEDDLAESNLKEYFIEQKVPELIVILDKVDEIIEHFIQVHFTEKQKIFTLDDVF